MQYNMHYLLPKRLILALIPGANDYHCTNASIGLVVRFYSTTNTMNFPTCE